MSRSIGMEFDSEGSIVSTCTGISNLKSFSTCMFIYVPICSFNRLLNLKFLYMATRKHTCSHASVGLAQARPNKTEASSATVTKGQKCFLNQSCYVELVTGQISADCPHILHVIFSKSHAYSNNLYSYLPKGNSLLEVLATVKDLVWRQIYYLDSPGSS